jgi:hypothetical protein
MSRRPRDSRTLDLLSWTPPALTRAFDQVTVRAASLRTAIVKGIAVALKECGKGRDQVAREMSDYLGESCPKNMLDAYAAESHENHTISLLRFVALIAVTRDIRLLSQIAELMGWAVIPAKYLPAIEEAMLADKIEELQQRKASARKTWKGA